MRQMRHTNEAHEAHEAQPESVGHLIQKSAHWRIIEIQETCVLQYVVHSLTHSLTRSQKIPIVVECGNPLHLSSEAFFAPRALQVTSSKGLMSYARIPFQQSSFTPFPSHGYLPVPVHDSLPLVHTRPALLFTIHTSPPKDPLAHSSTFQHSRRRQVPIQKSHPSGAQ